MKKQTNLREKIWRDSKPAKDYPKDWIVIPALDVNELIKKKVEELKEGIHDFNETKTGDIARNKFIDKIFGPKLSGSSGE